jgi:hypothetical protein
MFHAVQSALNPLFIGASNDRGWLIEGTAHAIETSESNPTISNRGDLIKRTVAVPLDAPGITIARSVQDFWVFVAKKKGGFDYFKTLFERSQNASAAQVDAALDGQLGELHWQWAKYQLFEGGGLLRGGDSPCQYDEKANLNEYGQPGSFASVALLNKREVTYPDSVEHLSAKPILITPLGSVSGDFLVDVKSKSGQPINFRAYRVKQSGTGYIYSKKDGDPDCSGLVDGKNVVRDINQRELGEAILLVVQNAGLQGQANIEVKVETSEITALLPAAPDSQPTAPKARVTMAVAPNTPQIGQFSFSNKRPVSLPFKLSLKPISYREFPTRELINGPAKLRIESILYLFGRLDAAVEAQGGGGLTPPPPVSIQLKAECTAKSDTPIPFTVYIIDPSIVSFDNQHVKHGTVDVLVSCADFESIKGDTQELIREGFIHEYEAGGGMDPPSCPGSGGGSKDKADASISFSLPAPQNMTSRVEFDGQLVEEKPYLGGDFSKTWIYGNTDDAQIKVAVPGPHKIGVKLTDSTGQTQTISRSYIMKQKEPVVDDSMMPPPPPPPGCGAGGYASPPNGPGGGPRIVFGGGNPSGYTAVASSPQAQSNGDPHVATLDGLYYTAYGMGEHIYAISSHPNSAQLQVRHQGLPGYASWGAFNTAAAVRMGGHTFEVRLPASLRPTDSNILLIDGQVKNLTPGQYRLGDVYFQVEKLNELLVRMVEPEVMPSASNSAQTTTVRIGKFSQNDVFRANLAEATTSLNVTLSTPLIGRYRGLFGVPDGNAQNDLTLPDGSQTTNLDTFTQAWKVKTRNDSLFTYENGQGPETFDVPSTTPPTLAVLKGQTGGPNYYGQAESLLRDTCQANMSALDPLLIQNLALELAVGRSLQNLISTGICYDPRVFRRGLPETPRSGIALQGKISLSAPVVAGVPGAKVVVFSPTLGQTLCTTTSNASGNYQCAAAFDTPSQPSIELQIEVSGRGPRLTRNLSVANTAGVWQEARADFTTSLERVLEVSGQVLRAGSPAVATQVRVAGLDMVQATTGNDGRYRVLLPLPNGVTSGSLAVTAALINATGEVLGAANASSAFTANDLGVTMLTQDLNLDGTTSPPAWSNPLVDLTARPGKIALTGFIENALLAEATMPGAKVVIESDKFVGGRCETSANHLGRYLCEAQLTEQSPLIATARVVGYGSSDPLTFSLSAAELPAPDGTVVKALAPLQVRPAMLRLTGRVTASNAPVVGAEVRLSSTNQSLVMAGPATTDNNGQYLLQAAIADIASQNLAITVTAQNVGLSTSATGNIASLSAGVFTSQTLDLTFNTRQVAFTGKVLNSHVAVLGVPGATVTITRTSPTRSPICTVASDSRGLYSCDYTLFSNDSFNAEYSVTGRGSSTVSSVVVNPNSDPGLRVPVATDLTVTPTTLKLTGRILDQANVAAPGSQVAVASGQGTGAVQASDKADFTGRYTTYLSLPDGVIAGTVAWTVNYQGPTLSAGQPQQGTASASQAFSGTVGSITTIERDLALNITLDSDAISLAGQITNSNALPEAAAGLRLRITGRDSAADLGVICETVTAPDGRYSCPMTRIVRHTNLEVAYSFFLGGQTLVEPINIAFNIIPGGNTTVFLSKDITIAPATVVISGTIRDQLGHSVVGARLDLTNTALLSTTSDAQGEYKLAIPMATNALQGSITAKASFKDNVLDVSSTLNPQAFNVAAASRQNLPAVDSVLPLASLRLSGSVKDGANNPINAAQLEFSGAGVKPQTVQSNATGAYTSLFTVDANKTPLNIAIKVTAGANVSNAALTVPILANVANTATQDFVVENRVPGTARWSVANTNVDSAALAPNGTLYVVSNNALRAIKPDGSQQWQVATGLFLDGRAPLIGSDGLIYVQGDSNRLTIAAYNPDGTERWRTSAPEGNSVQYTRPALAANGTLYAISYQQNTGGGIHRLYGFTANGNLIGGTVIRNSQLNGYNAINGDLLIADDGTLYVNTTEGVLALNPDGSLQWQVPGKALALGANGQIYLSNNGLFALDRHAQVLWQQNGFLADNLSIAADGTLYTTSYTSGLKALTASGTLKWSVALQQYAGQPVVGADGTVYINHYPGYTNNDSGLLALNPDGTERWYFSQTSGALNPLIATDGTIYSGDSAIYAVNSTSLGLANSPWPRRSSNNQNTAQSSADQTPRRLLHFKGVVSNINQPGSVRSGAVVTVKLPDGTLLCQTVSDSSGQYFCGAPTATLGALGVTITAKETIGELTQNVMVNAGTTTNITIQDMALPITTLNLQATIKNTAGVGIAGATLNVVGNMAGSLPTQTANANGQIATSLVFSMNTSVAQLMLRTSDGSSEVSQSLNIPLNLANLTNYPLEIIVDDRQIGASRWSLALNTQVAQPAVASDGSIYLGGSDGYLRAFNPDKTVRWAVFVGGYDASTPVIGSNNIIYLSSQNRLIAVASSGVVSWTFTADGTLSTPAIDPAGSLYVNSNQTIYAINVNGTERWSKANFGASLTYSAPIIAADGTIYINSLGDYFNPAVLVLNPDGSSRGRLVNGSLIALAADGTLYVRDGGKLVAYDADGREQWFVNNSYGAVTTADGGIITNHLGQISFLNSNGSERWNYNMANTNSSVLMVGADGVVYAGTNNALIALNADGSLKWQVSTTGAVQAMNMASDGTLYLVYLGNGYQPTLAAINSTSLGLANSSWPKAGGNAKNTSALPALAPTTRRLLHFTGTVSNANVNGSLLANTPVKISLPDGRLLCAITTNEQGQYDCSAFSDSLAALNAEIQAWYGEHQVLVTANITSGTNQTTTNVTQNLAIPITTLRVHGTVHDGMGIGLANLQVQWSNSSSITNQTTVLTGINGEYSATFTPTSNDVNFTITVSDGTNTTSRLVNLSLTSSMLNENIQDFILNNTDPGTAKWSVNLGDTALGTPAIGLNGRIYVLANDGLRVYQSNGTLVWTFNGIFDIEPVIGPDGTIYVGKDGDNNYSAKITAIYPNGTQRWVNNPNGVKRLALTQTGDLLVLTGQQLLALSTIDGLERWQQSVAVYREHGILAIAADGMIYAGGISGASAQGRLTAFSALGIQQWTIDLDNGDYSGAPSSIALGGDGTVYIGTLDRQLKAFQVNGTLKWSLSFDSTPIPVLGMDGAIYINASGLKAIHPNGTIIWESAITDLGADNSPLIASDSTVYVGKVKAFNTAGGQTWSFNGGSNAVTDLNMDATGMIYTVIQIENGDKKLVAINTASSGLANSNWPKYQQNARNTGQKLP